MTDGGPRVLDRTRSVVRAKLGRIIWPSRPWTVWTCSASEMQNGTLAVCNESRARRAMRYGTNCFSSHLGPISDIVHLSITLSLMRC